MGAVSTIRPLVRDDATALAELYLANRDFLASWEPIRPDDFFTEAGQLEIIDGLLERQGRHEAYPQVILDQHNNPVGRINLNNVIRGPFLSGGLGYWVSATHNGQGLATTAVGAMRDLAFGELGLHRLEASTLLHNAGSQRVLERNGFARFGLAPEYLQIAGRWQDHVLFQVTNPSVG